MKRNIAIIFMLLLVSLASVKTYAKDDKRNLQDKIAVMTAEQKEARMKEIKARVDEIQYMDKSNLSSEDRKALRLELRSMNKEARAIGKGGIYISFAGIIIIILVLILIL